MGERASVTAEGGDRRATRIVGAARDGDGLVNPAVRRGSTVLFPTMDALRRSGAGRFGNALSYGTYGTDTHCHLADLVAEIEGGTHAQIVSTGLAAITTPLLGLLRAGDHVVACDSVYGPTRRFLDGMLAGFGVATTWHDPRLAPEEVGALFTPRTRLLVTESPGSNTFEMQDVAALSRVAHARGALVMFDNTWGFGTFDPFASGVDISVQALTKYAGGHADVLLGAFIVRDEALWRTLRDAALHLGQYASPDDCWLALRGLRTLEVRLQHQGAASVAVAHWLARRPEIARVLHPALPGAPGHEIWKRDYSGTASLFGVEFAPRYTRADAERFVDALRLFGKGWSWGGFESLVTTVSEGIARDHAPPGAGALIRLHVGLEAVEDLVADLDHAFVGLCPTPRQDAVHPGPPST